MINHKLGRNIFLIAGFFWLLLALIPWKNKMSFGPIFYGIQGVLFLLTAYLQQKEVNKTNKEQEKE